MDSKVFICFILMKDRYGLVSEGNVLVFNKYNKSGRVMFCAVWITGEGAFI